MTSVAPNKTAALALAVVTLTGAAPLRAQDKIVVENDVQYANPDNQRLQLNLARPDGPGPYPAVVCIHGGGFRAGTRQSYDDLIKTPRRERLRGDHRHLPPGA